MDIQTRSEEHGIQIVATFAKALTAAEADPSIWKISFTLPTGERIRLVRDEPGSRFYYESILEGMA